MHEHVSINFFVYLLSDYVTKLSECSKFSSQVVQIILQFLPTGGDKAHVSLKLLIGDCQYASSRVKKKKKKKNSCSHTQSKHNLMTQHYSYCVY